MGFNHGRKEVALKTEKLFMKNWGDYIWFPGIGRCRVDHHAVMVTHAVVVWPDPATPGHVLGAAVLLSAYANVADVPAPVKLPVREFGNSPGFRQVGMCCMVCGEEIEEGGMCWEECDHNGT